MTESTILTVTQPTIEQVSHDKLVLAGKGRHKLDFPPKPSIEQEQTDIA